MPRGGARAGTAPSSPSAEALGARLRAARQAQRRTLLEVAQASDLTKGFLSRLERGRTGASVAALVRVCQALDIPISGLFEAPPPGEVVREGAYPPISFGGRGLEEHLLTPRGERRIQVILSRIDPGGGGGEELYALPSDVDFVLVLEGRLEIAFDGHATSLETGDAFTFDPSAAHTFRSVRDDGPTRVLWVLSPALDEHWSIDLRDAPAERAAPEGARSVPELP